MPLQGTGKKIGDIPNGELLRKWVIVHRFHAKVKAASSPSVCAIVCPTHKACCTAARFKLSKHKSDDIVVIGLHNVIYKRQGKVSARLHCSQSTSVQSHPSIIATDVSLQSHERKKNILDFSGFVFDNEEVTHGCCKMLPPPCCLYHTS